MKTVKLKKDGTPKNSGGSQPGAGRKNEYGEEYITKNIGCPKSRWPELHKIIKAFRKAAKEEYQESKNKIDLPNCNCYDFYNEQCKCNTFCDMKNSYVKCPLLK